jgi:hypothetical protein
MKKIMTVLVAVAMIGAAALAGSATASARGWHGHGGWHGRGGWGPGPAFGGFVAGALLGGALAAPYYYPYGYYGYYGPYPYRRPCYWRTVWNGYRWVRACY